MSRANSTGTTLRQKAVIIGILGILGIVLMISGGIQGDMISIVVGGGAVMITLATYSAIR